MITELYIENYRADVVESQPSMLNFAIDDVIDFGERSTTWSKTIKLPGTKNNNKILGNIFQIGHANEYNNLLPNSGYNFNASKSASCIIFQDNIQTFSGVVRLMQINIDNEQIEYEVAVFGTLFSLNVALSGAFLTDLDFSEYDHTYNLSNIVASWDSAPGSGYYYPLIDYGTYSTNKHDWDIRTFRPALYVKEYIDKIFAGANFEYQSDLFDSDRFKKLIVPYNKKKLTGIGSSLATLFYTTPASYYLADAETRVIHADSATLTDFTADIAFETITYTGASSNYYDMSFNITGVYNVSVGLPFYIRLYKNFGLPGEAILAEQALAGVPGTGGGPPSGGETPFSTSLNVSANLFTNGDVYQIEIVFDALSDPMSLDYVTLNGDGLFKVSVQEGTTIVNINPGDQSQLNQAIPQNIRQIDFLVSIVKLFNLYVYGDKFNDRLIYLKPYVDFYSSDSPNSNDWTYKMDRKARRTITPMSELNSKIYKFNFKSDSDYYNDIYNKRYGEGYGSYTFDTQYEFATETNSLDLIFAPSVLVGYVGEDKIYSTIFKRTGTDSAPVEENTDSIMRIMQTKKIDGVESWDVLTGLTILDSLTAYGYAGHYDDPNDPSNDLNFGALNELFFALTTGDLSITQFNVYWSSYMAEITDKDSKLLAAEFYLKPKDIFDLDFSKYINVDGVLFRLNKINDYNTSQPDTCKAELLKVINTIY